MKKKPKKSAPMSTKEHSKMVRRFLKEEAEEPKIKKGARKKKDV